MNVHLETLLEIQDLKSQRRELQEMSDARQVEQEVFGMRVDEALEQIDRKIEEMQESLDPRIRARYTKLAGTRSRAVVPVIGGTCYGCFTSIPTALASDADRNAELRYCDNCGRFLYLID